MPNTSIIYLLFVWCTEADPHYVQYASIYVEVTLDFSKHPGSDSFFCSVRGDILIWYTSLLIKPCVCEGQPIRRRLAKTEGKGFKHWVLYQVKRDHYEL